MRARSSGSFSLEFSGRDVLGQVALLDDPFGRVLEGGHHHPGLDAQPFGDAGEQLAGILGGGAGLAAFLGDQRRIVPDRRAVLAPVEREGPARQASRRDTTCPGRSAGSRPARSGRATGGSACRPAPRFFGPTAAVFHSSLSKSSIETKVGSPPMVSRTSPASSSASTFLPKASSAAQLSSENGLVMRGCSAVAGHLHVEVEIDLGIGRQPDDRRGVAVMRRRRQRDMAFAGQEPRGRVEPDPAGAGQIDLAPGMQIGEVVIGARGAVERLHDRLSTGSDSPSRTARRSRGCAGSAPEASAVAAGARAVAEGLLGRLHPGLHPDHIARPRWLSLRFSPTRKSTVPVLAAVERLQIVVQPRPHRLGAGDRW